MKYNNDLEKAYNLVLEKNSEGTVSTPKMGKPGTDFVKDGQKQAKGMGTDSPSVKSVKKPKEMEENKNPGHGKITEDKEIANMVPDSKFDQLFKSTLLDEESIESGANPLEQTGEGEFNDESGDFPPESGDEDVAGEVDVATELRLIIDRLTTVAEKLGAFDKGTEGSDSEETDFDAGSEADMAGDLSEKPVGEAVTYGKGGKGSTGGPNKGTADGKLKTYPDKTKTVTKASNMKVKSAFNQTANGKGKPGGPGKGAADGKLKSFTDTSKKMQSASNMVVDGGTKMSKVGKSIFD